MGKFIVILLFGWSGVHKFIEKKTILGIIYFFTFGLFGIGWLVDIIIAGSKIKNKTMTSAIPKYSGYTLRIDVVGEHYRKNEIASVMSGNGMYNIPDAEFMKKVDSHKNIYRFKFRETEAKLIPEPTNPHDANAIKVMIDGVHVGYIPADRCMEIKKRLPGIKSITAKLHGGDYKYHSNNEVFKTEANFSIELYISI